MKSILKVKFIFFLAEEIKGKGEVIEHRVINNNSYYLELYITSYLMFTTLWYVPISLFYRCRIWSSKKLSHLFKFLEPQTKELDLYCFCFVFPQNTCTFHHYTIILLTHLRRHENWIMSGAQTSQCFHGNC